MWIATGVLMIVSGVMGMLTAGSVELGSLSLLGKNDLPEFAALAWLNRHARLLTIVQLALAAISIVAGAELLNLRPWARTAIEVLSWLSLAWVMGFAVFWFYLWGALGAQLPVADSPIDPGAFRTIGIVIGALIVAVLAVPILLMIKYLRGPVVRRAIAQANY